MLIWRKSHEKMKNNEDGFNVKFLLFLVITLYAKIDY
jgi:hypothetical protein